MRRLARCRELVVFCVVLVQPLWCGWGCRDDESGDHGDVTVDVRPAMEIAASRMRKRRDVRKRMHATAFWWLCAR